LQIAVSHNDLSLKANVTVLTCEHSEAKLGKELVSWPLAQCLSCEIK